jgi:hypothetical protein
MILLNYIISTLESINIFISTFLLTSSLTLLYLDNLKLSNIKLIKYIQIFSFVCVPIYFIYNMYYTLNISVSEIIFFMADNKDIDLHGHVKVDKEAGKAIGQGLQTIGSQLGLGATIAGVATAVSKTVAKSGMPPIQKASVVVGSGIAAGFGHTLLSSINRKAVIAENKFSSVESITNSQVQNFINDSHSSPLQDFLFSGEMLTYVSLSLTYILVIQLVYKLYFKDTVNLNLSKFLGINVNSKVEFYLNKTIKLNKQMSII